MKTLQTITVAALFALSMSGSALAAGLTDIYNPYVTVGEIEVQPSMVSRAQQQLQDIYDPFVLSMEISGTEVCVNPAEALITDQYDPFVTLAEIKSAQMRNTC